MKQLNKFIINELEELREVW